MTQAVANANFHSVTPVSVFDHRHADPRFQAYRKRWKANPENFTVESFPLHLDIESAAACNLRCPFCATTTQNWGKGTSGTMPWELYTRIIDEGAREGLSSVKLSFRGEPTLHPKLPDMVAYAKEKGILDIYFNTNATRLNEVLVHRLIDAGLPRISISFEGITREQYENYRVGAHFDQVVDNVRKLKTIRDARGEGIPQIRVQTLMLPELEPRFSRYVDFWKPHADEVAFLDMRHESPQDNHRGKVSDWACPFLWQRMTILWDGTLLPCLMHGVSDFSLLALGNVQERSIRSLWLSAQTEGIRQLHQQGRAHELEACDRCSFRSMELEKKEDRYQVPRNTSGANQIEQQSVPGTTRGRS